MNKTAKTSLLLAAVLTAVLCVSCGEAEQMDAAVTTGGTETAVTEAETDLADVILDAIPEGTDFGGKEIRIRINEYDQTQYDSDVFMRGPEEADGDVVHDAILARNQAVEERLNVTFTYGEVSLAYNEVYNDIQKIIMAGDDVYDMYVDQQSSLLKVAANNMLYNVYRSDANDFSQNYWWDDYMEQIQISSEARYLLAGDYFLDVIEVASAIFFNKNMFASNYESADELYQMAFDGKWTIDALGVYIKDFSVDVDGNGTLNEGDTFAMNLSRNYMDAQCWGSGIDFMTRGEDGFPVINMFDERATSLMEKIVTNYIEPGTTYNYATVSGVTEAEYYQNQRKAFANRELLFLNDYLAAVKDLRDMPDDYGILPVPKLDETIPEYRSISHDTALVGGIPTTCPEPDTVLTVVEALCSMSHHTTMTTYFESAMKVKYARDESSARMIDLLHDSITQSFPYAYTSQMGDYYEVFRSLFDQKSAAYPTTIAKKEKAINKALQKLIDAYLEIEE